mgnify:CR=1 FL=1
MPRKDGELNISIMFESCNLNEESGVLDDFLKIQMDSEYYVMLMRMEEASIDTDTVPYYFVRTKDLKPQGMLRPPLEAMGAKSFRVYLVGYRYWKLFQFIPIIQKQMIFVGFKSYEEEDIQDVQYNNDCLNYISYLKKQLL